MQSSDNSYDFSPQGDVTEWGAAVRVFVGDPRALLNWPLYCRTNKYFEEELRDRDHVVRMHGNLMGVCIFKVEPGKESFSTYSVASNKKEKNYLTSNGLGGILILQCSEFLQGALAGKDFEFAKTPIGPCMHHLISEANNPHAYHFRPKENTNRILGFPDLMGPVTLKVLPNELRLTGRTEIVIART